MSRAAESTLRRIAANPYIPQLPTPKQLAFLLAPEREVLFGGAAGPGKSSALLMAALEYVDQPGYSALLLRRSYADLALPGALMDRADDWLRGTAAVWHAQDKTWAFPSGATLSFGYLQTESDKYRYQSAELQYIGYDELTQFREPEYVYLLSRLRRLAGSQLPLRMRTASNPGNLGHEWVKARFIDPGAPHRRFIPALLTENPHLDRAQYEASLMELDPVTRDQLLRGDWDVRASGGWFKYESLEVVEPEDLPPMALQLRYWDMAATEAKPGKDPDWTVGVLMGKSDDGRFWILDVQRFRRAPADSEVRIKAVAKQDGRRVEIRMEQEPGSSGVIATDHFARHVLTGHTFEAVHTTGNKSARARPWAAAVHNGLVKLVRGPWNRAFIDEHVLFPQPGSHDDQVDAASGAHSWLADPANADAWAAYMRRIVEAKGGRSGYQPGGGSMPPEEGRSAAATSWIDYIRRKLGNPAA